ncbi:hypothetical protein AAC387_Pa07g2242 [Persea americana]
MSSFPLPLRFLAHPSSPAFSCPATLGFYHRKSPPLSCSRDTLSWKGAPDGQLSMKLAWNNIRSKGENLQWPSLIWNGISFHKISCFGWRLMHNRTPIGSRLQHLRFSLASRCSICCNGVDSSSHLFFSCAQARSLWH